MSASRMCSLLHALGLDLGWWLARSLMDLAMQQQLVGDSILADWRW